MKSLTETRSAYGEALVELGSRRQDVVTLDADLYKSTRTVFFRDSFPDRFFDMGISEADMVSTAAGMASQGLLPFCNSFAMFITGLCYMQVRTQICYPRLPVILVGSSAGLTQGPDGASHQALEDIALMRLLPNMSVLCPADDLETQQCTFSAADHGGPVYLRVGRYPVPRIHGKGYHFSLGKIESLRSGSDVVFFATGIMVYKSLEAASLLAKSGISAAVMNVSTIKPLDQPAVLAGLQGVELAVSVEEHSIIGGLGGAVAECMSAADTSVPLLRLGVNDVFGESGLADELLTKHGLQPEGIAKSVEQVLRKDRKRA